MTALGLVAIETVAVGDIVIATDPETGETAEKEVLHTFINETDELVHLTVNGEEIVSTPGHKFYAPEKGWTLAIDLCEGDILVLVNGEYVVVEQVQHEILEFPVKIYNFEVEDFHTYYVGEQSVLVHNEGCGNKTPDLYHYTDEAGAMAISESGVIIPDDRGRVFVTTDEISPQDANNALFMGTRDDDCATYRVEITLRDQNDANLSSDGATQNNELIYYGSLRNGRNATLEVKPNDFGTGDNN